MSYAKVSSEITNIFISHLAVHSLYEFQPSMNRHQ
jgi:hypothetical protein